NTLKVLLGQITSPTISLEKTASAIAPAVESRFANRGLPELEALGGILKIGIFAGNARLVNWAFNYRDALDATSLRRVSLEFIERIGCEYLTMLSQVVAVELSIDPKGTAAFIRVMENYDLRHLVTKSAAIELASVIDHEETPVFAAIQGRGDL